VIDDFVKPLYRAVHMGRPLDLAQASILAEKARRATASEVLWMLGSHWRPRLVGAWFSMIHRGPWIDAPRRESLRTSIGSLTAPDLGYAAARRFGADALPDLHQYQARAARENFGGLSEISALIESLGGRSKFAESTEGDREALTNRRAWADHLTAT
jgi:hypothetical protein